MADEKQEQSGIETPTEAAEEYIVLDPVAHFHAIWRHKVSLVTTPLLCAVLLYGISYARPKMFTSVVRFMPPNKSGSLLMSLSRSGGGSGGDEYRAELESRTVGLDVVRHLHIKQRLHLKDDDQAWETLLAMTKFSADINNFVTITAKSKDPNFSAEVANEYYAALNRFLEGLSAHEAEHRLNYMSAPLNVERQRLRAAEEALREAQSRTGLVLPEAQASLGVQQVSDLRSRISALNGQLATARTGATDVNPRIVSLRSEITNLEGQVHSLENKSLQANSPANLPTLSLEVTRRMREVQFHTSNLEALTKSLETLQSTESYTPSLSLVDAAYASQKKSSPLRALWAFVGLVAGFILALLRIILRTGYDEWKVSTNGEATLMRWRQSWRRRSEKTPVNAD